MLYTLYAEEPHGSQKGVFLFASACHSLPSYGSTGLRSKQLLSFIARTFESSLTECPLPLCRVFEKTINFTNHDIYVTNHVPTHSECQYRTRALLQKSWSHALYISF